MMALSKRAIGPDNTLNLEPEIFVCGFEEGKEMMMREAMSRAHVILLYMLTAALGS